MNYKIITEIINNAIIPTTETLVSENQFQPSESNPNPFSMQLDDIVPVNEKKEVSMMAQNIDNAMEIFDYQSIVFPSYSKKWAVEPESQSHHYKLNQEEEDDDNLIYD